MHSFNFYHHHHHHHHHHGIIVWKHSDDSALPAASHNHLHSADLAPRDWLCPLLWRANAQNLEVVMMIILGIVLLCLFCHSNLKVCPSEVHNHQHYIWSRVNIFSSRISVIFRVRSAKAVKITDMDLIKRLGAIVGMFILFLIIRTLMAPPKGSKGLPKGPFVPKPSIVKVYHGHMLD